MRELTAVQQATLQAPNYWVASVVEIQNGSGTWVDLKSAAGVDWVTSVEWGDEVDQRVMDAVVTVRRDVHGGLSLAPMVESSPLNRLDDGVTYAPLLDAGRRIRIKVATTPPGRPHTAADLVVEFDGEVDALEWSGPSIVLQCRALGAVLVDRQVEQPTTYGTEAGRPIEAVMQDVLDDWAPGTTLYSANGTPATPFDPADSPGFLVTPYEQDRASVMDALLALEQLVGWTVRYKWNAAVGDYVLTFSDPARDETEPVWTFGPHDYFDVLDLDIDRDLVRNAIEIDYPDAANPGARAQVYDQDDASIQRYGRRFLRIQEPGDSPIDTAPEATAMRTAALSDLSSPAAEQEIETLFWWPGEVGDLCRFLANGVHYDSDQLLAVTSIRHRLEQNHHRTRIRVRGKPTGGYRTWIMRGAGGRRITRSAFGRLSTKPGAASSAVDLYCAVGGGDGVFPIAVEIFQDDPDGAAIVAHTFPGAGEIGPAEYPALNEIALPKASHRRWWAKFTDAEGRITWTFVSADRNKLPGGSVTAEQLRADAGLRCAYDDDVEQIVVTAPDGRTKTWAGLSGGGLLTYVVGMTLDNGSAEAVLDTGEERGPYLVEYSGSGTSISLYSGPLRGPVPGGGVAPPRVTVEPLSETEDTVTFRATIAAGEGGSGPIDYRYRRDVRGSQGAYQPAAGDGYAQLTTGDSGTVDIEVDKDEKHSASLMVWGRDAAGRETEVGPRVIAAKLRSIDQGTGRAKRAEPYHEGGHAFKSSDAAGLNADAEGKDSRGEYFRDMFGKTIDDADDVGDGVGRRVPTHSEADGGGRGYLGLNGLGDVNRDVPRARAVANVPAIDGVSGRSKRAEPFDEGGHAFKASDTAGLNADAEGRDSRGERLREMFAKVVDDFDDVEDGVVYKRLIGVSAGKATSASIDDLAVELPALAVDVSNVFGGTGREDVVLNGSFEEGFRYWGGHDEVAIETSPTNVYVGTKSFRVTSPAAGRRHCDIYQSARGLDSNNGGDPANLAYVHVRPGDVLRFRAAGRTEAGKRIKAGFRRFDGSKDHIGWSTVLAWTDETAWSEKEATYTVPAGTHYVVIWLMGDDWDASAGFGWFDNIHVWRRKVNADIEDVGANKVGANSSGDTFLSTLKDSRGELLNDLFTKVGDDLDDLVDGLTYKRTTANQRDGGGRGYLGLNGSGDVNRNVPRAYAVANVPAIDGTSGRARRSEPYSEGGYALKASNTSGLNADSSVRDSRSELLSSLFAKGADDADDLDEGLSHKFAAESGADRTIKHHGEITQAMLGTQIGVNLAPDASFEADPHGSAPDTLWYPDLGSPHVTSTYSDPDGVGSQSMYFPGPGGYHRIKSRTRFNVREGQVIRGRLRAARTTTGTAKLYFALVWDEGGYTYFFTKINPSTSWGTYSGEITVPAGKTGASIWIFNYKGNSAAVVVDSVFVGVDQSANAVRYADGTPVESLKPAESGAQKRGAGLTSASAAGAWNGSGTDYVVNWDTENTSGHDIEIQFYRGGSLVATTSGLADDGAHSQTISGGSQFDDIFVVVKLMSGTSVVDSIQTSAEPQFT